MRWYRLLKCNEIVGNILSAVADDIIGYSDRAFWRDVRLNTWDSSSWVGAETPAQDGEPDDFLHNTSGLPIVSPKMRAAMESSGLAGDSVQFLPIHVRQSTGEEMEGFSVINTLTRIEAIDRENCFMLDEDDRIDPETGKPQIRTIGRAAVFAEALKGHDVVRLLDYPRPLICSERFAKMWAKHKFTGANPSPLTVTPGPVPPGFKAIRHEPATFT